MSHHFDYTADERLDISDAYCFAGPSDAFGPRTVFGMNASSSVGTPWDPAGYYELKLDTNEDLVEDITWRFTFPVDSAGIQHVVVAELTGREATDRNAKGRIITPPNAPVGEVLEVEGGLKIFAGPRTDSFFNFIPFPVAVAAALKAGTFPDLAALFPPTDTFLNNTVRSVLVEAPAEVTGLRRLNYWATTAIYDQGHGWAQLQRAGGPNGTTFWNFVDGPAGININATVPTDDLAGRPAHPDTDPATGVWGQVRDQTAAVVAAGGTYNQGDPRPAHRAGLRRLRGRHIPPHGHPVHPRHQRPVGPLAGQPQRQGPDRRRVRQRRQSRPQPGLRLRPYSAREAPRLLPLPLPAAGKLTRHREHRTQADPAFTTQKEEHLCRTTSAPTNSSSPATIAASTSPTSSCSPRPTTRTRPC
jgi:hypothetical protein